MELQNENKREFTMGAGKITLLSFLLIIPIAFFTLAPFIFIWDYNLFETGRQQFMDYILPIILLGIVVHEGLHGIAWAIFAKNGLKSISFGINWNYLSPYCHCKEPLRFWHYFTGAVLPLVITGLIPSIAAIIIGNGFLLSLGILFIWAAGGDIIMLYSMRHFNRDTLIADHPDKIGFYVIDNI
jgi:hypothetical protein